MNGTALIYRAGPDLPAPETFTFIAAPSLDFLQKAVGGYIERVPLFNRILIDRKVTYCVVYCNEESKLKRQPVNRNATRLWDYALRHLSHPDGTPQFPTGLLKPSGEVSDMLVGDIVVLYGDDEFMEAV